MQTIRFFGSLNTLGWWQATMAQKLQRPVITSIHVRRPERGLPDSGSFDCRLSPEDRDVLNETWRRGGWNEYLTYGIVT